MEFPTKEIVIFLFFIFDPAQCLFVPEQLPTLLSFVYTNIPPIRKGIDSRVGFGFRLGPNADVQVMLELGPQQNTAPLGPQKSDGNSKRETRIPPYKYKAPVKGSWLHAWRQQQGLLDDGEDVGVIPAQPAMDQDIVNHLHQLYKEQPVDRSGKDLKMEAPKDVESQINVFLLKEDKETDEEKQQDEAMKTLTIVTVPVAEPIKLDNENGDESQVSKQTNMTPEIQQ